MTLRGAPTVGVGTHESSLWRFVAVVFSIAMIAAAIVSFAAPSAHAQDVQTKEFTAKVGALIETIYLDAGEDASLLVDRGLPAFARTAEANGGELFGVFEVQRDEAIDRDVSHVALFQWPDADARSEAVDHQSWGGLDESRVDSGFFAVQQDTAVTLRSDRVYDFTHAFTIAKSPEQMEKVMQVLGVYFQGLGPIAQRYGIETKMFTMAHPAPPAERAKPYQPQIMGLFEWRSLDDIETFRADPEWLAIVDVRNATFARPEDTLFTTAVF